MVCTLQYHLFTSDPNCRWIDRVQPWVHYVPIQVDHSDLYDAYIFFRGGLYGEGNHDELAKRIATAGRTWSRTFWRKEDMTAYFFRYVVLCFVASGVGFNRFVY